MSCIRFYWTRLRLIRIRRLGFGSCSTGFCGTWISPSNALIWAWYCRIHRNSHRRKRNIAEHQREESKLTQGLPPHVHESTNKQEKHQAGTNAATE